MALVITLAQAEALVNGMNVEGQTSALSVFLSGIIPCTASSKLMAEVLKMQDPGSKLKELRGKKCFSFHLQVVLKFSSADGSHFQDFSVIPFAKLDTICVCAQNLDQRENVNVM